MAGPTTAFPVYPVENDEFRAFLTARMIEIAMDYMGILANPHLAAAASNSIAFQECRP
jgi:hypothetical protein